MDAVYHEQLPRPYPFIPWKIEKAKIGNNGLGLFIRPLVVMDREAAVFLIPSRWLN